MLIEKYMTPVPTVVSGQTEIWKVEEIFKKLKFQHMPVIDDNGYGLLTIHDIKLVKAFSGSQEFLARDFMSQKFISVNEQDHLKDVIKQMISAKDDCAIVFNNEKKLVGIFTTNDALKILYSKL